MPSAWFEQFGGGYGDLTPPGWNGGVAGRFPSNSNDIITGGLQISQPPNVINPDGTPGSAPPLQQPRMQPTTGGQNPQQAIQAILQRYPPGSEGLQQAMPEIQRAFPGTRFDTSGGPVDEIVIPGYGLVDVLANAETGGPKSWTWQTSGGMRPGMNTSPFVGGAGGGKPGTLGAGVNYGARLGALQDTPGYQFRFNQGMNALEGSAASKGLINSGAFAKDAMEFGQGLASTEFDNEYRRLFGLAGLGQGAAGQIGAYGSSYGDNATNLITGQGDARAGASVAGGNAWNNALGGVGQTAMDAWMYNQMLNRPPVVPGAVASTPAVASNPYPSTGWG